jgi:hypothetical protein
MCVPDGLSIPDFPAKAKTVFFTEQEKRRSLKIGSIFIDDIY